jgi:hypothetical protein
MLTEDMEFQEDQQREESSAHDNMAKIIQSQQ